MTKESGQTSGKELTNKGAVKKDEKKSGKDSTSPISSSDSVAAKSDASGKQSEATGKQSEPSTTNRDNYVRGESQKPVTKAYRDNWNRIFKKS